MKLLEWIEMLIMAVGIPFSLFVLLPFTVAWLLPMVIALWT